jgi:hypothetical protein
MTWRNHRFEMFRYGFGYDRVATAFPRLDGQRFPLPRGPRPRKSSSLSAIAGSARAKTSPSIDDPAQAVLGCVTNVLVWVEEASRLCYSSNRRELASSRVSSLLGMGLQSQTSGRTEARIRQSSVRERTPKGRRLRESVARAARHAPRDVVTARREGTI